MNINIDHPEKNLIFYNKSKKQEMYMEYVEISLTYNNEDK